MLRMRIMKAGRNLDAEVAEKVMGLIVVSHDWPCGREPECGFYEAAHVIPPIGGWYNKKGPVVAVSADGWPPHKLEFENEDRFESDVLNRLLEEEYADVEPVPFYSITIVDAEKVIKRLNELGLDVGVRWLQERGAVAEVTDTTGYSIGRFEATAPLAICLLSLDVIKTKGLTIS